MLLSLNDRPQPLERRPKLLDLYCKAGGGTKGYEDAGFEVWGVDIEPQPNYIAKGRFIQADAITYLKEYGHLYDAFHASPPCQAYSRTKSLHSNTHPELIEPTRAALIATGKPYIIENVPGAPLINPVALDGTMFDLRVIRKRLFESNVSLVAPPPGIKKGTVGGKNYNRANPGYYFIVGGHQTGTLQQWRDAMGIDWMNKQEMAQAIPPAYTFFLGQQLIKQL